MLNMFTFDMFSVYHSIGRLVKGGFSLVSCNAASKNHFGCLTLLGEVCPPLATENKYTRVEIPWDLYLFGRTEMLVHYAMFSINMVR